MRQEGRLPKELHACVQGNDDSSSSVRVSESGKGPRGQGLSLRREGEADAVAKGHQLCCRGRACTGTQDPDLNARSPALAESSVPSPGTHPSVTSPAQQSAPWGRSVLFCTRTPRAGPGELRESRPTASSQTPSAVPTALCECACRPGLWHKPSGSGQWVWAQLRTQAVTVLLSPSRAGWVD